MLVRGIDVMSHASRRRAAGALLVACASAGCAGPAEERIATAEAAIEELAPEVPVSIPGQSARSASAAWIKSASLSLGHALVGFTAEDRAGWAHSASWSLSAPEWNVHRSDDLPPFGWPEPENFCALYACEVGAQWGTYTSVAQATWTGLDDVAVLVATGGPPTMPQADVVVLSSTNGGQTFDQAQIVSVPTPQGDSGGYLVQNTVHASLMYTPERTNTDAGVASIPIYIVWQNFDNEGAVWWMAQIMVGIDGSIAQTRPRRRA